MDAAVTDLCRARGLSLARAKGSRVKHIAANAYLVPSQAANSGGYVVDVVSGSCTCPDFEERGGPCKHLWALRFVREELPMPDGSDTPVTTPVRPTYPQNWPAYNAAQCEEKERVQILLRGLCEGIQQPVQAMGRPRHRLSDIVYAATMKVYGTMSGRRSTTRMFHLFSLRHEEFLSHYHQRSNVEATFSAIKRKFGAGLRSKGMTAQVNEVLLKCLAFNMTMLVHAIREFGVEPTLWMPKDATP